MAKPEQGIASTASGQLLERHTGPALASALSAAMPAPGSSSNHVEHADDESHRADRSQHQAYGQAKTRRRWHRIGQPLKRRTGRR